MTAGPLRVVQWATGSIDTKALCGIIEHPSMDLVGVRVYGEDEVAVRAEHLEIAAGTIPAGTVAGQRVTVSWMRNGEPLLRFRANWLLGLPDVRVGAGRHRLAGQRRGRCPDPPRHAVPDLARADGRDRRPTEHTVTTRTTRCPTPCGRADLRGATEG